MSRFIATGCAAKQGADNALYLNLLPNEENNPAWAFRSFCMRRKASPTSAPAK